MSNVSYNPFEMETKLRVAAYDKITITLSEMDGDDFEYIVLARNKNIAQLLELRKRTAMIYFEDITPESKIRAIEQFEYINDNLKKLIGL